MSATLKIKEITCKSAIGKCGFPGGGLAINPYVGCSHNYAYCYARFIKRFTGHNEAWGSFVDARINIAEVLEKQIHSKKKSSLNSSLDIHIGTVTDPYQPAEEKYQLTRKVLQVLANNKNIIGNLSILTKSNLVLRDIDLLKQFNSLDVNFTVNTLDEKWKVLAEPGSPSVRQRLNAMQKLSSQGIKVMAMMGPYWPFFTNPDELFKEFKAAGVVHVFSESVNTVGGNWTDVEEIMRKNYPNQLSEMKTILFDKKRFDEFYNHAEQKIILASKKYNISTTIFFGQGHAAKFK